MSKEHLYFEHYSFTNWHSRPELVIVDKTRYTGDEDKIFNSERISWRISMIQSLYCAYDAPWTDIYRQITEKNVPEILHEVLGAVF